MTKYKKLHLVTQGGYGTIFKAIDPDGRLVVLKDVILANLTQEKVDIARKEALLLSSLQHPHIVRYLDHWETSDMLTIAMEYAEKGSLEKYIVERTSLFDEIEAIRIFVQVLLAVEFLHRKGIIHRDICARNVLIFTGDVIKVCDFGVSKRLRSARTGSLAGDPAHFAPELCQGKRCSKETDMWATGCLFHHLLSLKPPFKSSSLAALLVTILAGPLPPIPRSYSQALETLIFSLLSSEPASRPEANALLSHPLLVKGIHTLHLAFTEPLLDG